FVGGDLLNQRLWRRRFFSCGDADRAFDPFAGRALNVVEHFTAASAVAPDNVAVSPALQLSDVWLVAMPRSPTTTMRLRPKCFSRSLTTSGTVFESRQFP